MIKPFMASPLLVFKIKNHASHEAWFSFGKISVCLLTFDGHYYILKTVKSEVMKCLQEQADQLIILSRTKSQSDLTKKAKKFSIGTVNKKMLIKWKLYAMELKSWKPT